MGAEGVQMQAGFDDLADFERRSVTVLAQTRDVFVAGTGPGVIIMHEMPGITPQVAAFARMVRDAGFSVYMPLLFGEPGRPFSPAYMLGQTLRMCISREFSLMAANRASPIVDWLRALAVLVHGACGGRGIGALGMCITGNFALTMMLEPAVRAPVLCQPSLPAIGGPGALHASRADVAQVRARLESEDLTLLAYRFEGDSLCPAARFTALEKALGPRFLGRTLPDSAANPDAPLKQPHSVVTNHLINEAGQPTHSAVQEILAFFRAQLDE